MSPIKGLTDRNAQFPCIGAIRKGAPKPESGNKPGADLRYFRVTFDQQEEEAARIFARHYGPEPAELDILLPFATVEENFEAWREAYLAGGLIHRCDGERVHYEIDPATGDKTVTNGLPEKFCDGSKPIAHYNRQDGKSEALYCRPAGRLRVLIPQLQRAAYLTVLTGSLHDIMNLSRQLDALYRINGSLAGVPLELRRRPVMISTPSNGGKRVRREKWLLSIEADPSWVRAMLSAMKAAALPGNGLGEEPPLLEAPADVEDEEDELQEPAAPEIAPQGPSATKSANPIGDDPATRYWATIRQAGLDHDAGKEILREFGGDFDAARKKIESQELTATQEEIPF